MIASTPILTEEEYKTRSYDELSTEFKTLYPKAVRTFQLIPQMYNRLTLIDNLSHREARLKITNDHKDLPGFSDRNVRRYLPLNNPNVPHRIRTSWHKNSNTKYLNNLNNQDIIECKKSENDELSPGSVSDFNRSNQKSILSPSSSANNTRKSSAKSECQSCQIFSDKIEELNEALIKATVPSKLVSTLSDSTILNFEFNMPFEELRLHMSDLFHRGQNIVWFSGSMDRNTGRIIALKVGKLNISNGCNRIE